MCSLAVQGVLKRIIGTDKIQTSKTYGACVLVVYSLNSLSWMVKYGRKSQQNLRGLTELGVFKKQTRSQLLGRRKTSPIGCRQHAALPDESQYGFRADCWRRRHDDQRLPEQRELPQHLQVDQNRLEAPEGSRDTPAAETGRPQHLPATSKGSGAYLKRSSSWMVGSSVGAGRRFYKDKQFINNSS